MNPDDIIYNLPYALTFPASVQEERIAEAVQKVAAAHPALFCNFVQESEGVMMKMAEDRTLTIASKALTPDELQAEKEAFPVPSTLRATASSAPKSLLPPTASIPCSSTCTISCQTAAL